MKKINLYIYDLDTNIFGQVILNATFERQTRRTGLNTEYELYFAVDPDNKKRTQIAEKSENVFYDKQNHRLTLWLYDNDISKAKKLFGNYILNFVNRKIDEYTAILKDLTNTKEYALKLLD